MILGGTRPAEMTIEVDEPNATRRLPRHEPLIKLNPHPVAPGAESRVLDALSSGRIGSGPNVEVFEAACTDMASTNHAIAVANGTVSLELLLEGLGIGPGDEVITTSFTFAATVSSIVRCGAVARLVDIAPDGTIDVDAVAAAIGPRTVAVVCVHLFGQPADLPTLKGLCDDRGLALIEDAAQAHGAAIDGRPVGGWGHGSFSFYATKNVSCGEGGAITTNDAQLAARVRLLRNQGMSSRHHHDVVGTNVRMSELHAAVGLASMARRTINARRRSANAHLLLEGLRDQRVLDLPTTRPGHDHAWHQFTVALDRRDALGRLLARCGIETGVHYPRVVQDQPAFAADERVIAEDCPRARHLAARCLSLPVHHDLCAPDARRVIDATIETLGELS